jgi:hypothetical protein
VETSPPSLLLTAKDYPPSNVRCVLARKVSIPLTLPSRSPRYTTIALANDGPDSFTLFCSSLAIVPEPASLALLGEALTGFESLCGVSALTPHTSTRGGVRKALPHHRPPSQAGRPAPLKLLTLLLGISGERIIEFYIPYLAVVRQISKAQHHEIATFIFWSRANLTASVIGNSCRLADRRIAARASRKGLGERDDEAPSDCCD